MIASHKRISAVAACLIFGMAGLLAFFILGNGGVTIAFAEVRKHIQGARSLVFDLSYVPTEGGEPHRIGQAMFKDPGLIRFESHSGGTPTTIIVNAEKAKILSLNPDDRTAVLVDLVSGLDVNLMKDTISANMAGEIVDDLKELVGGPGESLGQKTIDGKKALGFRAALDGRTADIWVDKDVGDVLLVEIGLGEDRTALVLTNIQMNTALDDSLFSLTPPKEYELIQESPMDVMGQPSDARQDREKDLTDGLRLYAKCQMGKFPPEPRKGDCVAMVGLNAKGEYVLAVNSNNNFFSGRLDEVKKRGTEVYRVVNHCRSAIAEMKKTNTWEYIGEDVKLGDAQGPICWYRPEGSSTYRVFYGDLSVKDVKPEDLPTEPAGARESE